MKRLLLIVLPLLLIVGCSEVEGQQQLIPNITERYSNGNIQSITYYKKTRDGIEKVKEEGYHYKGQKESEIHYKDGKKDGKWTKWWDNGQKRFEGTIKDGKQISSKYWYEDGSVRE